MSNELSIEEKEWLKRKSDYQHGLHAYLPEGPGPGIERLVEAYQALESSRDEWKARAEKAEELLRFVRDNEFENYYALADFLKSRLKEFE